MVRHKNLVMICIGGIVWVLIVILTQHAGYDFVSCPSRLVYDLPCAGCGGTRAFLLLIKGHPIDAFFMNPNVYLVVPYLAAGVCLMVYDMIRHTNLLDTYSAKFNKKVNRPAVYIPIIIFELCVWGYNIWRYKHGQL